MTIEPGTTLLHYRIAEKIGEGGMGVVWKAVDTSLDREVAIKVLPPTLATEPERLARFEREAKLLASLQHPSIASVFGLHESDGLRFLAMEMVPGEDLARRLERGPLPLEDAIAVAEQIAAAVQTAHEAGVIHRDLKPANIVLTADDQVKVLDFGLAKALETAVGAGLDSDDSMHSPTLTSARTQAGVILGTAAYMAPEQARGKAVDRRADVWAFGAVLWEMVTGVRLFQGETNSDTLAAVLREEIDWSALPSDTPPALHRLLRRCLTREPARRLQSIGDARLELDEAAEEHAAPAGARTAGQEGTPARRSTTPLVLTLATIAIIATLLALWAWMGAAPTSPPRPTRLSIALPLGEELQDAPAISRDGRTIAYVSRRGVEPGRLWVRSLDAFERQAVPGSEDAAQPFFSPDARSIGFIADGALKVVELGGGTPRVIAPAPASFGATWLDDGRIVFTSTINSGLLAVPASGGEVERLTEPDLGEHGYAHVWPRALPGGMHVLFTIWAGQGVGRPGSAVYSIERGEYDLVWENLSGGHHAPSGHLLVPVDAEVEGDFAAMLAAPYSVGASAVGEDDGTVLENVYGIPWREQPWLAVSQSGTLAYVPGSVADRKIVWYDREGNREPAIETRAVHDNMSLSPDGRRVVLKNAGHLWVHDLDSGTRIRLTSVVTNGGPVWDPGGRRIVFSSNRGGDWDLYVKSADGTGEAELLWKRNYSQWANGVAPDGTLLIEDVNPESGLDLWTLKPGEKPAPFLVTPENEEDGAFSPDGKLIAYTTNESGRPEVYLLPFPGPGPRVPVSREGGQRARWSPDGTTLFYMQGDAIMAATVLRDPEPRIVDRRRLFTGSFFSIYAWVWDVAPDGRFLMIEREPGSVPDRINVVLDWTAELAN
jgi:Tol biopolymer transport system component/tRNA A-37 threonylcarbamoyl transferase component Bud32